MTVARRIRSEFGSDAASLAEIARILEFVAESPEHGDPIVGAAAVRLDTMSFDQVITFLTALNAVADRSTAGIDADTTGRVVGLLKREDRREHNGREWTVRSVRDETAKVLRRLGPESWRDSAPSSKG